MLVELNSVWRFNSIDEFEDGLYRVLAIYTASSLFIVFPLIDKKELLKPRVIFQNRFLESVKKKTITKAEFIIPFYINTLNITPNSYLIKRDENFRLIKGLVDDYDFLLEISTQQRSKKIANHARKMHTYVQKLYRSLNSYWRYGQDKNALIPAYKLSGASGEIREPRENKRGRPISYISPSMDVFQGVNTTEQDRKIFVKALNKFRLKEQKFKYSRIYYQMLDEYYADKLIIAESHDLPPKIPSYRSFIYWIKKLIPEQDRIRKQTNQGDFDRNHRGFRGSAIDHTSVIGSCFELDATVLDVHVVSEFQRNHVLGRPTFYCVLDKVSRMVVGIHVSMEYASWRAGRQALVNSFSPKRNYCARFGIDINESDWPCHHIPQRLLCDRGEFICKNAEELAVPLIGHLSIAPPYRPDRKGSVEHRFKIFNDDFLHEMIGTTRGRNYVRGDKDPRLEAALTLTEITKMLIDDVIGHNNKVFDSLFKQSTLLIEHDLKPTPLNYWNIHFKKYHHALSTVEESIVRARLLPVEIVSMTSHGVRLNDEMYYETDHPEFEIWKELARKKRWKLEARIDQDNSSFIYVLFKEREGFIKCSLMKMSSNFSDRHTADVFYFEDWKKMQKSKSAQGRHSIEKHKRREATLNNAKNELKNAPPIASKKEKTKDMKARRKEAILDNRLTPDSIIEEERETTMSTHADEINKRNKKIISMMKRKNKE